MTDIEIRTGLRLIFFPSPMPIPEHPDIKVVLDKAMHLFIAAKEEAEREAKLDEAAEIHLEGFNIRMQSSAASVVAGGTELDKLLTIIERRHGKDMVLYVGGKHNHLTKEEGTK